MKEFWLSFSFINFLIINLLKSMCQFMCVYVWSFYNQDTRTGIFILIQCFFLYLEILLFIIIFIHKHYYHFHYLLFLLLLLSILQLPSNFYHSSYVHSKSLLISNLLCTLSFFLPKLYIIFFCQFFKSPSVPFFFPHSFSVVTVNCDNRGEFKSMNSSGIVYTYLSTPIGNLFLVSIFLFCSLLIKSQC